MSQNYIKINRLSLKHDYFCYADVPKYKADLIFLTALPDTRSWQVPKEYRVSTSEPAV